MGTSHRHKLGVVGQPNWGKVSSSVTGIANDVIESDNLNNQPPDDMTPDQIFCKQGKIGKRIINNYHHAVRNIVRASGGRAKVSSGKSLIIGHAGIIVLNGFINTLQKITSNGLLSWLQSNGILSLEGRTCQDLLDLIRNFINHSVTGLDDTAANDALEHIFELLEDRIGNDVSNFEEQMNKLLNSNEIKNIIDEFFGFYIFSHLSQDFAEKLENEKGSEVMRNTMSEIKEQIMDDIATGRAGRSVEEIDWSSPEGEFFIRNEFDRIIFILSGNED